MDPLQSPVTWFDLTSQTHELCTAWPHAPETFKNYSVTLVHACPITKKIPSYMIRVLEPLLYTVLEHLLNIEKHTTLVDSFQPGDWELSLCLISGSHNPVWLISTALPLPWLDQPLPHFSSQLCSSTRAIYVTLSQALAESILTNEKNVLLNLLPRLPQFSANWKLRTPGINFRCVRS